MLKKIFGGILSFSKKMLVALLTKFVNVGMAAAECIRNVLTSASTGMTWVAEKAKESHAVKLSKLAIARAMLTFIGGLLCCFIFPEDARGDLTWFSKMLTSAMDWTGTVLHLTKVQMRSWMSKLRPECEVT